MARRRRHPQFTNILPQELLFGENAPASTLTEPASPPALVPAILLNGDTSVLNGYLQYGSESYTSKLILVVAPRLPHGHFCHDTPVIVIPPRCPLARMYGFAEEEVGVCSFYKGEPLALVGGNVDALAQLEDEISLALQTLTNRESRDNLDPFRRRLLYRN